MKCQRQPVILNNKPVKIAELWEVHLTQEMFSAIVNEARRRHCSYSAITRYCAFRLAEKVSLRSVACFRKLMGEQNKLVSESPRKHRHMVCLYGEDAKLLRLAALRLGVTVSAFIRLALVMYLPRVAMEFHSKRYVSKNEFFAYSIKRWKTIPYAATNRLNLPYQRRYLFNGFPPEEWWGAPLWNSIAAEAA